VETDELSLAVVMQRKPLKSTWQPFQWLPAEVVLSPLPGSAARCLRDDPSETLWLYPGMSMRLYSDEAEGYFLNLDSGSPCWFIMWRLEGELAVPQFVTLSYNEAARLMDGGEQVDTLPLPPSMVNGLAPSWRSITVRSRKASAADLRSKAAPPSSKWRARRGRDAVAAETFFARWSRVKTETLLEQSVREADAVAPIPEDVPAGTPAEAAPTPTLEQVESLTPESDFTPFIARGVDETVRRAALKKLFADPRFNVMDGLDTYVDDYNKFEPLTPLMVAALNHAKDLIAREFAAEEDDEPKDEDL